MWQGEGNVQLVFKLTTNINISTWTCSMVVTRPDTQAQATYSLTPSTDGTQATYTTNGSEFPVAGRYTIDFHALAPGFTAPNKDRVYLDVQAAN